MIIKFRVNGSSSYAYGWSGFAAAITTAATATAGSTPANPNINWLPEWEVIANDTAGGWLVNRDDFSAGTNPSSGYIRLYTQSAKGSATYKTKGIQFYTNSTSQDSYYGHVQPKVYVGDASGNPIAEMWLQAYGSSQTTTARYDTWSWNYAFGSDKEYIVICTEEYFYCWQVDADLNSSTGYLYRLVGVCDHTYSSPVEAHPASQHMPFYGVGIMSSNDQGTASSSANFNMHVSFAQHVNPNGFFNSLISGYNYYLAEHEKTSAPNVNSQNYITALYPNFYANNASGTYSARQYMSSTFNTQGLESATINDIMVTGPAKGTFTRVLKGIKWAGVNRASSGLTIKAQDYQLATLISDEDTPQEYLAIASGGHVFCHPKK